MNTSPKAEPIHLLTDWRDVACRKREQKGEIRGSRNPADVTCARCMAASAAHAECDDAGCGACYEATR